MPYTCDTTNLFCTLGCLNGAVEGDVLKAVVVVSDTEDTTDVANVTNNLDVRGNVLEEVVTLAVKADNATYVCTVVCTVLGGISLYVRCRINVYGNVSPVGVCVLTAYTAYVSHTVNLNVTGNGNVGVLRSVRSTCNYCNVKTTGNLSVVDSKVLDLAVSGEAEETNVALVACDYKVGNGVVSAVEYTLECVA